MTGPILMGTSQEQADDVMGRLLQAIVGMCDDARIIVNDETFLVQEHDHVFLLAYTPLGSVIEASEVIHS